MTTLMKVAQMNKSAFTSKQRMDFARANPEHMTDDQRKGLNKAIGGMSYKRFSSKARVDDAKTMGRLRGVSAKVKEGVGNLRYGINAGKKFKKNYLS